jgi:hypothetical protein
VKNGPVLELDKVRRGPDYKTHIVRNVYPPSIQSVRRLLRYVAAAAFLDQSLFLLHLYRGRQLGYEKA